MDETPGNRPILGGRGQVAAVLVLAGTVLLGGLLAVRGCPPPPSAEPTVEIPEMADDPPPPMVYGAVAFRGRVRVRGGEEAAVPESEPEEKNSELELKLELKIPRACTVTAWSLGHRLGAPVACDRDGGYRLELTEAPARVALEIIVPGHLRAVLEVEPRDGGEILAPTVALGPAFTLAGQVMDRRGHPVADVHLRARPNPDLGEPEPWRAVSQADGRFAWDTLPPGPIVIDADKRGYAPTVVEGIAPEAGITVVLDEIHDLHGEVLGGPAELARARVRVEGSSLWPPLEVAVASDGSFVVPGLVDGVYGVVAVAPAVAPGDREYASTPIENISSDMHVSLGLIEALRVPVRVVGPDGAALPGARVTVSGGSVGILQQVAETDAEGLAAVGPLVPGPYLVHADADGYLPSETVAVDAQLEVPIPAVDLRLLRPGQLRGKVVDEGGRVVAGARVTVDSEVLYSPGESQVRARTLQVLVAGGTLGVTRGVVPPIPLFDEGYAGPWIEGGLLSDRDGAFVLGGLSPGVYRLRALHENHAASTTEVVRLRAGEQVADVVLLLQRGQPLTGRLRTANGQPVVGARVEVEGGQVVVTDALGVFDVGLHRGRRRLILRAPGMIPQALEVDVGDQAVDLERTLEPAEGAIVGRLRDPRGQPLAGARIALFADDGISASAVTYTDDRGLFDLEGLTPGGAQLEVEHPDFAPFDRRLRVPPRADGELVEIGLEAGWAVAVHVRASGSGDPIAGARVRIGDQRAVTDAAGDAVIRRLVGDAVVVEVEASGWVRERSKLTRPPADEGELVVDLDEGAALEGSLQDERGEPVARARVVIRDRRSGELVAEVESEADGTWRVDRLGEGDVIVEATPPPELAEILAPVSDTADVLRGHVTRGVALRFDRR